MAVGKDEIELPGIISTCIRKASGSHKLNVYTYNSTSWFQQVYHIAKYRDATKKLMVEPV